MCGIFAAVSLTDEFLSDKNKKTLFKLANLSERRGSDASGILSVNSAKVSIVKSNTGINKLIQKNSTALFSAYDCTIMAGHSRLSTHGDNSDSRNNQPCLSESWIVIHNGIVTNFKEILSGTYFEAENLDTFAINSILEDENQFEDSLRKLEGENSFLAIKSNGMLIAYTNVGNLYQGIKGNVTYLASEEIFLKRVGAEKIEQLPKNTLHILRNSENSEKKIEVIEQTYVDREILIEKQIEFDKHHLEEIKEISEKLIEQKVNSIKRCLNCVLPNTFPGLIFDENQVCSLCNNYVRNKIKPISDMYLDISKMSKNKNEILLNLSGGRDSSYCLLELAQRGIKIVAFTYDWGFISTAARENMSKFCGKFGIEHVLVSPNITLNRKLVKSVLETWLKYPDLGTIPLLMSGDKPFHTESLRIAKERKLNVIVQADHYLENTGFKSALAGAKINFNSNGGGVSYKLNIISLIKMILSYMKFILRIRDNKFKIFHQTVESFRAYYLVKHNFLRFFNYNDWNEDIIDYKLKNYGWKSNRENIAKWRMGDLTAPLYNLLYIVNLGFTEHDAMFSNLIRAGKITREKALIQIEERNKLDLAGILEYLALINVDSKLLLEYLQKLAYKEKIIGIRS